ncbi:MAG TPA: NUDIX hydrolase N-terminal domain-containing protein [Actinomycetota bacterium]|nr:NUDIX hydrolase N-terminal domain-containing protein [Actinomycetota bacterium]
MTDLLRLARELQSLAQTGLRYAADHYATERYEAVRRIAAQLLAGATGPDVQRLQDLYESQTGDATPKVDVRAAVFDDLGRILLVRETSDAGRWTLPGGWANVNDTPSESVVREVVEETGFVVEAAKLLMVQDRDRHNPPGVFHSYKLFFSCTLTGGSARGSHETSDPAFFARDSIPHDLSLGRTTPTQIRRCFEHLDDPDLPTDFD